MSDQEYLIVFQAEFFEDIRFWAKKNRKMALRVLDMVKAIGHHPFEGIGKPEPLKAMAPGAWSRRLSHEHRIVYLVQGKRIDFLQARYCY